MIKSSKHIERDLWTYIKGSSLVTSDNGVTGGVYRGENRPDGSRLEDIVVKFLTGNDPVFGPSDFQTGVLVVNVYVNDIDVSGYQRKLADTKRIEELSEMLVGYVESHYDNEYQWYLSETPVVLDSPETVQHFINARIRYNRPIETE